MDPREELNKLRKMKRLQELEAKAGQSSPAPTKEDPTEPSLKDRAFEAVDSGVKSVLPKNLYDYLKPMAMGAESGVQGVAQGASLGNYKPSGIGKQAVDEHPYMNMGGKLAGGLTTGAVAGLGTSAIAPTGSGVLQSLGRIAANTAGGAAQGYATAPEEGSSRGQGAAMGGLLGGGLSAGLETAGGLYGAGKRMYDTSRLATDPARMQDKALGAISDATGKLSRSEAANLEQGLAGKSLGIDTTRLKGVSPEIDDILTAGARKVSPYGDIPSELNLPAQDVDKIRKGLDSAQSWKKLGPYAQDAESATKDAFLKSQADKLRGQLHGVSPEVSDTYDLWRQNLEFGKNLANRAESAPTTVLTSPSIDRRALLQKVDETVGTDLRGLGEQLNAAKGLSNAAHNFAPVDAAKILAVESLRGGAKGAATLDDPRLVQSLFSGINETRK